MMKMQMAAIGLIVGLAGCQNKTPAPGTAGSLALYRDNIRVADRLDEQLGCGVPAVQHLASGLARVSVTVTNLSGAALALEYRYTFTVDRIILESPMPFTRKEIPAGGTAELVGNTKDALPQQPRGNYLLEIRKAKAGE